MRWKGFKFGFTSPEELRKEFYGEFYKRRDAAIWDKIGHNAGMIKRMEFMETNDFVKLCAYLKLKLIDEWEGRGRKIAFLDKEDNPFDLIHQKHFGKPKKQQP